MKAFFSSRLPEFTDQEKKMLQLKVDFIGLNHYTTIYAQDCKFSCEVATSDGNAMVITTTERNGQSIGEPVRRFYVNNISLKSLNHAYDVLAQLDVADPNAVFLCSP